MPRSYIAIPRPAAEEDILRIYAYLHADRPATAESFFQRVRDHLDSLCEFPESGRMFDTEDPALAGLHVSKLKGFPVSVYYRIEGRAIDVVAVIDGRRDIRPLLGKP